MTINIDGGVLGSIGGTLVRGRFQLQDELERIAGFANLAKDQSLLVAITHCSVMCGVSAPSLILAGRVCGRMGFWFRGNAAYVQTDPQSPDEQITLRVARIAAATAVLLDPPPDGHEYRL